MVGGRERHPSLTALRALALLRKLEAGGAQPPEHVLREVRDSLASHVARELERRRRRRR
jgi:hypothetical protein